MKRHVWVFLVILGACAPQGGAEVSPEPLPAASALPKRSKAPKQEEWKKDGVAYPLTRAAVQCSALALREWIRVFCADQWFDAATTRFGPAEGVEVWQGKFEKGLFAVFPFRPGDRRVIEFTGESGVGKYGAVVVPSALISMTWLDGEGPIVTVD